MNKLHYSTVIIIKLKNIYLQLVRGDHPIAPPINLPLIDARITN